MVTVSFAANLRGRAGNAASLSSRVIPSETSNPRFAASPAEPSNAAAPIPPAACLINSLRFITPPSSTYAPFHYTFGRPVLPVGYQHRSKSLDILRRANAILADPYGTPANRQQGASYGTSPSLPHARPSSWVKGLPNRNFKTRTPPPSAVSRAQKPADGLARRRKAQRLQCRGVGRRRSIPPRRPPTFRRHPRRASLRRHWWRSPRPRRSPPRSPRSRHGRAVRPHGCGGSCPPPSFR